MAGKDCETDSHSVKHDASGLTVYTITSESTGSSIKEESMTPSVESKNTHVAVDRGWPATEEGAEDAYL